MSEAHARNNSKMRFINAFAFEKTSFISLSCKLFAVLSETVKMAYLISCIFYWLRNEISGKCFLTHLWGLGPRVCLLSHMLSVVCPPLLTYFGTPVPTQPLI